MAIKVPRLLYFEPTCHKVLDSYFYQNFFKQIPYLGKGVAVIYSNDVVSCSFEYWDQDFPNCDIMIGIGLMNEDKYVRETGIALSYDIPKGDASADYSSWRFHDNQSLETALTRIRDQVLPYYAKPLWNEPQRIRQLLTRRANSQSAKREFEETQERRKKAMSAFQSGNFREAIEIYNKISPVDYTPTDKKRIEIALKRLNL